MTTRKLRALFVSDPLIIVATVVMGSLSLLVSLFDSSGRGQHRVARAWSRMLLKISGIKVHCEGLEKIAPGGSYVFVANHRSYMDVPVIVANISVEFRFMANRNLFQVPFIGYHLKRAGHLPVDNANPRESLKSMSEAARAIHDRAISLLVFPEGERSRGDLLPFKDGAAYIAIKAGAPIVPLWLEGMTNILPRGSIYVQSGAVLLRIGDPIPTLDLALQDRSRLTQELYDSIRELQADLIPAGRI